MIPCARLEDVIEADIQRLIAHDVREGRTPILARGLPKRTIRRSWRPVSLAACCLCNTVAALQALMPQPGALRPV